MWSIKFSKQWPDDCMEKIKVLYPLKLCYTHGYVEMLPCCSAFGFSGFRRGSTNTGGHFYGKVTYCFTI